MTPVAARRTNPARWGASVKALVMVAIFLPLLAFAENKDYKYTISSGGSVSLVNQKGSVTVKPSTGRQVLISADRKSDKVEIDSVQNGNRINIRTHMIGKGSEDDSRVDYQIQVPQDASVSIESNGGQIRIENLRGSINVDSEDGEIDIRGVNNGFVQVQTVSGGVTLNDVKQSRVQVTSTGGNVKLNSVSGPSVVVKSTTGTIQFAGDFSGSGNYTLTNHTGDINVQLPSTSSVDLTARSVRGSVENDFPFQKPLHSSFQVAEGKAFAGTSNSGASSVELRSFSGKIRVKKQ